MSSDRRVIIVSGPPGAGKTTVASALAADHELGVHLESDLFYRAIRSGFVGPHLPEAHSQNTAVMDVVADAAASYAHAGYCVVWDGIVGPWFLDRVVRRLAAREVAVEYVVLRPTRETGLARVRQRDDTTETDGAEVMYEQFADLGEFEAHVVSADGPVSTVLDDCRTALAGGRLVVDRTPWVDQRWPVSVKGVLRWGDRFVVLRNRRGEWELPGGRLDAADATPELALQREIEEELGIVAEVGSLTDSWIYDVEGKRILVLTFECTAAQPHELVHSDEHIEVGLHTLDELGEASTPSGYLRSLRSSLRQNRDP